MYDFETVVDRSRFGAGKWINMRKNNLSIPDEVVPFSVADMEFQNAPEIISGLREFIDTAVLGYAQATCSYNDAVCNWMKRRHNWEIKDEWIVVSTGVVPAFFNAVMAFTQVGDGVIVMTPVYFPFYEAIENHNRKLIKNPLIEEQGMYKIDFNDLENKAKDPNNKVLLFCSPHNPVGRVWTKEELREIERICLENDLLVISDEIHFDLIMPGYKHTVFETLSSEIAERCITCTAPSKTFNIAGMQVSNIIISNKNLREKFVEQMHYSGLFGLNVMAYKSCELAYCKGERWLEELIEVIDTNRRVVEEYIKENIPQIKVIPMEGTYLQWWDCRELKMNYTELEKFMKEEAFFFLDEGYLFGDEGREFERINLACPTHIIKTALDRLYRAIQARLE